MFEVLTEFLCDVVVIVPLGVAIVGAATFVAVKVDERFYIRPLRKFVEWLCTED